MARTLKLVIVVVVLVLIAVFGWRSLRPARVEAPSRPADSGALRVGGELIASLRSEPASYIRYVNAKVAEELLSVLTDDRLVRVDRATDAIVPALAESWTQSSDGLTFTLKLRRDVRFSDGTPFTSADVLFSFRALYDPRVQSSLSTAIRSDGKPLEPSAPDDNTVVLRLSVPFAPGLRLLESLPILPRHKLEDALTSGTFREAWTPARPVSELGMTGLGPFVLTEHVSGQRMVFARNPNYWRRDEAGTRLPYLDKLTVLFIPDQNAEALRLEAGETDLMANGEIRLEDYATFKRLSDQGRLKVIDVGIGVDPNFLWFNLAPQTTRAPRPAWIGRREFRQAISYAADRQAMVNAVYLGAGVPIYGPVTPGNRTWYSASAPRYDHNPAKARELLGSIGLSDRNGDGMLEDGADKPVRFSIITQRGHTIRERTASVLQEQLRAVGIAVDLVALDDGAIFQRWTDGDYEAIYFGVQSGSLDPALNPDFWLSSGAFRFWNPRQPQPANEWERQMDDVMRRQMAALDTGTRQRLFADAQRLFGEELPAIYFVAPKVMLAVSPRVSNPQPSPRYPHLLWSADTLAAAGGGQ